MDSIKNFFTQIDGRIFDLNLSNLGNSDYLFNKKPEGFYMQSWAFVIALFSIGLMALLIVFLKKRREKLYIEKGKRHILTFHAKMNIVFFAIYFFLIFFRTQGMTYLSMRLIAWLFLAFALISSITAVVRIALYKPEHEIEAEIKTDDAYQKYLPRKNKKK